MRSRNAIRSLLVGIVLSAGPGAASADLINGDFATGDLTGWTATARDRSGNPTTPLITVETVGGNSFAALTTGDFATGPFFSTLQQSFTVRADRPFLAFDFSLPAVTPDPTGTGTGPFLDSFVVSLTRGTDSFVLLLVDRNGPLPDPFGTAPGTVALGVPLSGGGPGPGFDHTVFANLSALSGQEVTVNFTVTNVDDGLQFTTLLDEVETTSQPMRPIPEPSSLVLLGLGGLGLLGYGCRRRKRVAA